MTGPVSSGAMNAWQGGKSDSYGNYIQNPGAVNNSGLTNPHDFEGQYGYEQVGDPFYHYQMAGVRVYSPTSGTFLQADPIDSFGFSNYTYADGDPVNNVDPDGKQAASIIKAAASVLSKWAAKKSSKELAKNLVRRGMQRPPHPVAAHHIVAAAQRAGQARNSLLRFKIDINDAANGVFLPTTRGTGTALYHPTLHTRVYYNEVAYRLGRARTRSQAMQILNQIKNELLQGTFPH